MKRSLMLTFVAIAGIAILAVALIGFRLSQGGIDYSAYAHVNWERTPGTPTTHLELDLVQDAGGTWCNPVDPVADKVVLSTYNVAVCLSSATASPGAFQLQLGYNTTLNRCIPVSGGSFLDQNPDANVGSTVFAGMDVGDLGTGWNCNLGDVAPPDCGASTGNAFLQCSSSGTAALPVGAARSNPIAVVSFQALVGGVDNLTLRNVEVDDFGLNPYITCFPTDPTCIGATDNKVTPLPEPTDTPVPPTPTFTPVPPTNTPVPGVRMEKDAQPLVAGTQDTGVIWLMNAGCVVPQEGKGCLVIDENVFGIFDVDNDNDSDADIEGLGAWDTTIRFDHKFIALTPVPDNTWLQLGGRIANCTMLIDNENTIVRGCVSKDDDNVPGYQPGPTGPANPDGRIMRIYVIPMLDDLRYRSDFRPTKDNGIITDIVDDNCEVTDWQAEQIPGTLPGQRTVVCSDVHIIIRMLEGDTDLDCDVDVMDDQSLAFRYGTRLGMQLYSRWFDLEPRLTDDDIDIKDLQFVFGRNGSTCQAPIPDDQAPPP
jgi:hypothetical protein